MVRCSVLAERLARSGTVDLSAKPRSTYRRSSTVHVRANQPTDYLESIEAPVCSQKRIYCSSRK
jgi:hypothetical protein